MFKANTLRSTAYTRWLRAKVCISGRTLQSPDCMQNIFQVIPSIGTHWSWTKFDVPKATNFSAEGANDNEASVLREGGILGGVLAPIQPTSRFEGASNKLPSSVLVELDLAASDFCVFFSCKNSAGGMILSKISKLLVPPLQMSYVTIIICLPLIIWDPLTHTRIILPSFQSMPLNSLILLCKPFWLPTILSMRMSFSDSI